MDCTFFLAEGLFLFSYSFRIQNTLFCFSFGPKLLVRILPTSHRRLSEWLLVPRYKLEPVAQLWVGSSPLTGCFQCNYSSGKIPDQFVRISGSSCGKCFLLGVHFLPRTSESQFFSVLVSLSIIIKCFLSFGSFSNFSLSYLHLAQSFMCWTSFFSNLFYYFK